MDDTFVLSGFSPISLTLEKIGPFQDRIESFSFCNDNGEPCNYFLLLSQNGRGKTHILESLAAIMGVLGQRVDAPPTPFSFEPLAKGEGRAQLDFLVSYSSNGVGRSVVLSVFGGYATDETYLKFWSEEQLTEVGASEWHRAGVLRRSSSEYRWVGILEDEWARNFLRWINESIGGNVEKFAGSSFAAPTLIYFPAYRDVVAMPEVSRAIEPPNDWNYRPLHIFRQEGAHWRESLDNLLVWLMWLNDDRYNAALELVNDYVFVETNKKLIGIPNRNELVAKIQHEDKNQSHRLDQLSSGEKSLIQIFLRLGAHMTRNTILVIDELDAHLHPQWRARIAAQLKSMAQNYVGLTVIVASHADEIIESLNLEVTEPGLIKGGELLLTAEEEAERRQRIQEIAFAENETMRTNNG